MRAVAAVALAHSAAPAAAQRSDGYDLWLRYDPLPPAERASYRLLLRSAFFAGDSGSMQAAREELQRGVGAMVGAAPIAVASLGNADLIVGTPAALPALKSLGLPLNAAGPEGFVLRRIAWKGRDVIVVAGNSDVGVLRGIFALLRRIQTGQPLESLNVVEAPRYALRLLNHWDNLDRTVERGYAGQSLWDWHKLPGWVDPRYTDYARANASVGINGAVLNNVNASAEILTPPYLEKVAAIAGVLRPWGVRTYLSARFTAPIAIGGLKTADPLDPQVQRWWRSKADSIYRLIPDFGGFLIKANSEGQPGPQDYGRSHADGANMIADALAPHGGTVMWRAFIYSPEEVDRARSAYDEFKPLDGKFRSNVILQVKNGPIDFQPREPFHPLFGQMPATRVGMEVQITKEYLGFATHLAFLGALWEEVLDSRTATPRARVAGEISALAGVANIGTDRNWTGSHFDQANWYAFGRLAWNPTLRSSDIAQEWSRMTWGNDRQVTETVVPMMLRSRDAVVDYMTPLGLTHLMATGHHYGPGPWVDDLERRDWNPTYYHRATRDGIGFDRTAGGSNAVSQYAGAVQHCWSSLECVPDRYLLWFHHVPWTKRLRSGRTLWADMVKRYDDGVSAVREMRRDWASLNGRIDAERYREVTAFLKIQEQEAKWWRDASIAYFQSINGLPLPPGHAPPEHALEHYKSLRFPYAPGN
ncbi:alpha-glucuronidase family glycosyl hydrolase [Sphingomonas sabuli]|nr:alpha-glucuronidase family glycosyl hydrolase [Sphingomonas sabuli]